MHLWALSYWMCQRNQNLQQSLSLLVLISTCISVYISSQIWRHYNLFIFPFRVFGILNKLLFDLHLVHNYLTFRRTTDVELSDLFIFIIPTRICRQHSQQDNFVWPTLNRRNCRMCNLKYYLLNNFLSFIFAVLLEINFLSVLFSVNDFVCMRVCFGGGWVITHWIVAFGCTLMNWQRWVC